MNVGTAHTHAYSIKCVHIIAYLDVGKTAVIAAIAIVGLSWFLLVYEGFRTKYGRTCVHLCNLGHS